MTAYALQMKGIRKSFHKVEVLHGVDFHLRKGEIHALLGENGAGKSTLMNILGGVFPPDEGEIVVDGMPAAFADTRASKSRGIGFIHQELNVVDDLRVYENMFLGSELTNRFGFVREDEMCRRCEDVLRKIGVVLDPRMYVRELDASMKQVVEIARALLEDANVLIMDEPTTSLTEQEVGKLIGVMRSLRDTGVSMIYISHKLKEIVEVCDRYTVLRDGGLAGTGDIAGVDEETLSGFMVGKAVNPFVYSAPLAKGEALLQVESLSAGKWFRHVSFTLRKGEILGFTGLSGDGRTELFECIFGYRRCTYGRITIKGSERKFRHPSDALQAGIALVPKNRKENAIVKDLTVMQNMTLASLRRLRKFGLIDQRAERNRFQFYKERLQLKVSGPNVPIVNLSGGNQQKAVLAKWLESGADILILDNPTQGIDVGAKNEIYKLIDELRHDGKSIVILTSEIGELRKLCDRVYVMYHGEITAELSRDQIHEETIMLHATGMKREEDAYEQTTG